MIPDFPRLLLVVACTLCAGVEAARADVTVFAAASLSAALPEVADAYEAETGTHVVLSFAGSSALARQIQLGAPADLFLSANSQWMDALEADGLIAPGSRVALLGNALVLVGHGEATPMVIDETLDLPGLLGGGRLSMALVDAVPAGQYGQASLRALGLWEAVAPFVAQSDNVSAALQLVALGEAPLGVVYATDARLSDAVSVLGTFPEGSHPPITYPAAAIAGRDTPEARAFLAFLHGPVAARTWRSYGFAVREE